MLALLRERVAQTMVQGSSSFSRPAQPAVPETATALAEAAATVQAVAPGGLVEGKRYMVQHETYGVLVTEAAEMLHVWPFAVEMLTSSGKMTAGVEQLRAVRPEAPQ